MLFGNGNDLGLGMCFLHMRNIWEFHDWFSWFNKLIWREDFSFWFVDWLMVVFFLSFRAHTAFKYFRWQFFCQACLCTIRSKFLTSWTPNFNSNPFMFKTQNPKPNLLCLVFGESADEWNWWGSIGQSVVGDWNDKAYSGESFTKHSIHKWAWPICSAVCLATAGEYICFALLWFDLIWKCLV